MSLLKCQSHAARGWEVPSLPHGQMPTWRGQGQERLASAPKSLLTSHWRTSRRMGDGYKMEISNMKSILYEMFTTRKKQFNSEQSDFGSDSDNEWAKHVWHLAHLWPPAPQVVLTWVPWACALGKNSLWVYTSSSESHLSSSGTFLELRVFLTLRRSHILCFPEFLLYLFNVT